MNAENNLRVVKYMSDAPVNFERVATVYQTTDYSVFTTYKSNREPDHVERIKANMLDKGYVSNPIIVTRDKNTKKMIVIDGNNRLHALTDLNLPVSFVILDDACENDMIALNLVAKNWRKIDYIRFYASRGNQNYIDFMEFMSEYPDFKVQTLEYVLKLSTTNDSSVKHSGSGHHKLERGLFDVMSTDRSREILDFCMRVKNIGTIDTVYNQQNFVLAIMRLFRCDAFDPSDMLDRMSKYKSQVISQRDTQSWIRMLEDLYNYRRKGGKVHFDV